MGDNSPFEAKVNEVVSAMTQDESGKWQLPADVTDEALIFAANAERRRRDTQSAYTKTQQQLKQLESERNHLLKGWEADFTKTLPTDKQAELEELKASDPDAWRNRLNELEQEQRQAFQAKAQEIAVKAKGETELDYRQRALEEFQQANPTLTINDDVIQNDVPPRLTKQLEKGEITFGEFLNQVKTFMTKGKVVNPKVDKANDDPDLGDVPGGSAPGGDAVAKASKKQYKDEIY